MSIVLPDTSPPDLADWSDPLSIAVADRDRSTFRMVEDALRKRRVRLAFQPVLPSGNPHRPVFYEALARILDPAGRPIPARDFIGIVETHETGRILDCVALELGLQALAADPALRLSVNMSARSIGYPRWTKTLEAGLAADPAMARRLILEITESSAMLIPDIVTAFMVDLQDRGIAFALDDFGQGFTSFRYLRDFDFDILKIDGQYIRGIAANPDNQVLARALVTIAGHFGMLTVAESVESPEDAAWLAAAGVDCLQGYHFAAPSLRPQWTACEERRKAG
jgi:EAL domain-containing protein (putative c-di-GMP-specific phosphodiesterase class I)